MRHLTFYKFRFFQTLVFLTIVCTCPIFTVAALGAAPSTCSRLLTIAGVGDVQVRELESETVIDAEGEVLEVLEEFKVLPTDASSLNRFVTHLSQRFGVELILNPFPQSHIGLYRTTTNQIYLSTEISGDAPLFKSILAHEVVHALIINKLIHQQDSLFHGIIQSNDPLLHSAGYNEAISVSEMLTYSVQLHSLVRALVGPRQSSVETLLQVLSTLETYRKILRAMHTILSQTQASSFSLEPWTLEQPPLGSSDRVFNGDNIIFFRPAVPGVKLREAYAFPVTQDFARAWFEQPKVALGRALGERIRVLSDLSLNLETQVIALKAEILKLVPELYHSAEAEPQAFERSLHLKRAVYESSLRIRRTIRASVQHWDEVAFDVDRFRVDQ